MRAAPEGSPIPVTRQRILLVDDDPGVRLDLQAILRADGYEVEAAESCRVARDRFRSSRPDAVIASCRLPDGSALDLLPLVKAADRALPVSSWPTTRRSGWPWKRWKRGPSSS